MAQGLTMQADYQGQRCLLHLLDEQNEGQGILNPQLLLDCFDCCLAEEDPNPDQEWEVCLICVDPQESADLHQQHFAVAGMTDCMSFPDGSINPENGRRLLGDVLICPAQARKIVGSDQQALSHELLLYALHGVLHCLGYDDQEPEDRALMWQRQQAILKQLGIADPSLCQEDLPPRPSLTRRFAAGAAMGCADAVPGVSGGTLALILGVYEHLLLHLASLIHLLRQPLHRAAWQQAFAALGFLFPLGMSLLAALFLTTRILVGRVPELEGLDLASGSALLRQEGGLLLHPEQAPLIFAFFFGLVAASVRVPWKRRYRQALVRDGILASLAALAAGLLVLLPPAAGSLHPLALMSAGAVAIAVMLLPGISGSLALLVLGMYHPVSEALHRADFLRIAWFLSGMILGLLLVVPLLRRLLRCAHDASMAVLSGLMLGSLIALWPWKSHYVPRQLDAWGSMQPTLPQGSWWWPVVASVLGAMLILILQQFGSRDRVS